MTDKQIIKKFSDNHCLVLENNQISLRENEFTAYHILLGKSTNELLEFVKDTYLQLQAKEQELKEICKAFDIEYAIDEEIGNLIGRCNKLYKKEQECEELKNIINEAKNSKLDLKSFLLGEAMQKEYEEQLDQLKAENEKLKHDNGYEVGALEKTIDNLVAENGKLKQTLTEIKEIAKEKVNVNDWLALEILQKISEVENE